jgi:hypothetical protein
MKKAHVQIQIGVVGVDSGQVLICDPCYIDSEWDSKDEYERDQIFDVKFHGVVSVFDMGEALKNGINFMTPLKQYENMTMNELVKEGLAKERKVRETGVFGYNGCCRATSSKDLGGQLNYKMGHAGAGVAVSSGYGDGVYPVIAHYNKDGRVSKVEILFDDED